MRPEDLLIPTPEGLFCPPAGVHVDPLRPVARALVTHGHSDHARPGHGAVMATRETLEIMALRYGDDFAQATQRAPLGATARVGEVDVSFHPAGHVRGSAQIRFAWRGFVAVVSGDYKRAADPTCAPFEPVPCDLFVSEATFGLPVFRHPRFARRWRSSWRRLGSFPNAPIWSAPSARQGPTRDGGIARGRLGEADSYSRSNAPPDRLVCRRRLRSWRNRSCGWPGGRRARRRRRDLSAQCDSGPLGEALRRPGRLLRLGLDARARPRPSARRRVAARRLGPRRLGRACARRSSRQAAPIYGSRMERRTRWRIGRAPAVSTRGPCAWSAMATKRSASRRRRARRPSHERIRASSRSSRLRALAQRQAAPDAGLFRPPARS